MKNFRFSLKHEGAFITALTYLIPTIGLLISLVLWVAGHFDP